MKYLVVLEKRPKPGCIAVAKTRPAVTKLIAEAIEFHIQGLKEAGEEVPPPRSEGKVVEVGAA